jgi:thiamine biosynthesis lipoprotein
MTGVVRFDAMGTWIEARGVTHAAAVAELFESVEARCSRFRGASELTLLNEAPEREVAVSAELAEILDVAARLSDLTGGLVDPAVGGRVIDWGYDRTFREIRPDSGDGGGVWHGAEWAISGRSVIREPGIRFDLGGIAKGWTADRAVTAGVANVVSAGGDVRSNDATTVVEVVDPWGSTAVRLDLGVGGLATSSTGRRRWASAHGAAHHIIDPRTGDPAVTPVVSATAVADTAAEAEAAAKAVVILGASGLAWAAQQLWIRSAVAVWNDGNVYATPGVEVAA